jgi:hypothetical protein
VSGTPIHSAVLSYNVETSHLVIELLIEDGCDVNRFNRAGETALVQAVRARSYHAIRALVRGGASVDVNFEQGEIASVYDVVMASRGEEELVRALEDGLGAEEAVRRRCLKATAIDPLELVGKTIHVQGLGKGFVVEASRAWLGMFGPFLHTVRFFQSGVENKLVLNDGNDNGGLQFFVCVEDNVAGTAD